MHLPFELRGVVPPHYSTTFIGTCAIYNGWHYKRNIWCPDPPPPPPPPPVTGSYGLPQGSLMPHIAINAVPLRSHALKGFRCHMESLGLLCKDIIPDSICCFIH